MDRLEALRIFCTVVDTGGFSRGAEKLGISTSTVTNQILALETHFRIKLLNRTTRRMSVTEEGRQCYDHAIVLLNRMGSLESAMLDSNRHPTGVLRVDMPTIISRQIVAPALPAFLAAYPDITLNMTAGDRMIDMVEEGIDVLIRVGELQDSSLIATTVFRNDFICTASPAFLAKHGTPATPGDLPDFPCLNFLNPRTHVPRPWRFMEEGVEFTHTPRGVAATDHVESLIEAAKAGCGIVQNLSISLIEPLASGALVPILQDWVAPGPPVSILVQQRHLRAAKVKVFVDFVSALFKR
jgi:LysR family transcriptional regulator for bpeEF and oprC